MNFLSHIILYIVTTIFEMEKNHVPTLNNDMLSIIIMFLIGSDPNKWWKFMRDPDFKQLCLTLQIVRSVIFTPISLEELLYFINIGATQFDLSHFKYLTDDVLALLPPNLEHLDLNGCNITDAGLALLPHFTKLHTLDLSGCKNITNAGLAHLQKFTNLEHLDLNGCNITDAGLRYLQDLPLETLVLSFCSNITDAGIAHLQVLPLQNLDLSYCRNITDEGLRYLLELHLRKLNLSRRGANTSTQLTFSQECIVIE